MQKVPGSIQSISKYGREEKFHLKPRLLKPRKLLPVNVENMELDRPRI